MTPVEHMKWWLKHASESLQDDPTLHVFTCQKWEQEINQMYTQPITLEEYNLSNEVYEILLIAFQNAIKIAEELPTQKWDLWNCMDVTEAYRLALMIGQNDPLLAVQMKVRINNLANRFDETVKRFASETQSILFGPITTKW